MPTYDGQMRLADNLVRIQEERNELLALNAVLVAACQYALDAVTVFEPRDHNKVTFQGIADKLQAALAAAQVPL